MDALLIWEGAAGVVLLLTGALMNVGPALRDRLPFLSTQEYLTVRTRLEGAVLVVVGGILLAAAWRGELPTALTHWRP